MSLNPKKWGEGRCSPRPPQPPPASLPLAHQAATQRWLLSWPEEAPWTHGVGNKTPQETAVISGVQRTCTRTPRGPSMQRHHQGSHCTWWKPCPTTCTELPALCGSRHCIYAFVSLMTLRWGMACHHPHCPFKETEAHRGCDANTAAIKEEISLSRQNSHLRKCLYFICRLTGSMNCSKTSKNTKSSFRGSLLCLFTLLQWLLSKKEINTTANLTSKTKPSWRWSVVWMHLPENQHLPGACHVILTQVHPQPKKVKWLLGWHDSCHR